MKAVRFHRAKDVRVDDVPDPRIEHERDAIVRVTATAICGSDLHIYNGLLPQSDPFVLGHEFMGVVEDVGAAVSNLKRGDRVVVPFPIACGACWFCERQLPIHCAASNPARYGPEGGMLQGKGGALFGYTDLYGGYDGGQAEAVRVPYADFGPRKVPEELTDDQVLFLSDILPTGYSAVRWAELQGGETVAVFGCGPVGLMAQKCARLFGAEQVLAVDILPYRLEAARRVAGSEPIDASKTDAVEAIRDATGGRGADLCVDAVGMEADRTFMDKVNGALHMERGTLKVLTQALRAVRRGGTVSVLGVYGMDYHDFPLARLFDKGVRINCGQAPVQRYVDELMEHVVAGRLRADDIITHHMPLEEAAEGYRIFNRKEAGCVKVVLRP